MSDRTHTRMTTMAWIVRGFFEGLKREPNTEILGGPTNPVCNFDRFGGQVGLVNDLVDIAIFVDDAIHKEAREGNDYPGVVDYEVNDPFGNWLAKYFDDNDGNLPPPYIWKEEATERVRAFFHPDVPKVTPFLVYEQRVKAFEKELEEYDFEPDEVEFYGYGQDKHFEGDRWSQEIYIKTHPTKDSVKVRFFVSFAHNSSEVIEANVNY